MEWEVKTLQAPLPEGYQKGTKTLKVGVPGGGQVERTPPPEAVAGDTFDVYLQSPQVSIVKRAKKEMVVMIRNFNLDDVVKIQGVKYKTVDEPRPGALLVKRVPEGSLAHDTLYEGDLITKVNNVTNCDGTERLEDELTDRRNAWAVTVLRDPSVVVM